MTFLQINRWSQLFELPICTYVWWAEASWRRRSRPCCGGNRNQLVGSTWRHQMNNKATLFHDGENQDEERAPESIVAFQSRQRTDVFLVWPRWVFVFPRYCCIYSSWFYPLDTCNREKRQVTCRFTPKIGDRLVKFGSKPSTAGRNRKSSSADRKVLHVSTSNIPFFVLCAIQTCISTLNRNQQRLERPPSARHWTWNWEFSFLLWSHWAHLCRLIGLQNKTMDLEGFV